MQSTANARHTDNSAQVQDVNATSGGLIKATCGAAIVAGAILTFIWLPAEYGIDPTGAGHLLGLTEMGHIKEQLHAEAEADAAAASAAPSMQATPENANINQRLDEIQAQLLAIAQSVGVRDIQSTDAEQAQVVDQNQQAVAQAAPLAQPDAVPTVAPIWRDVENITLVPGEGIELKLAMQDGAVAQFEWTANGAVLNHDTHGDGAGENISYEKGRSVPEQSGQLTAAFTGNHGWFWRNRTDEPVLLTLRTRGDYESLVRQ